MSNEFSIKRNDTMPSIAASLEDSDDSAIDLTGATVRFLMTPIGESTAKVDAAAIITDAANGKVKYDWQSEDTDTLGTFVAEWEITYSSGGIETVPSNGWTTVRVKEDLG